MENGRGNQQSKKGNQVIGYGYLRCVEALQDIQENDHRQKVLKKGEDHQADPDGRRIVEKMSKSRRLRPQRYGKHDQHRCIVAVEQDLQGIVFLQKSLAVNVVECTAGDAGKNQKIADQIAAAVEIELFPVDTGTN